MATSDDPLYIFSFVTLLYFAAFSIVAARTPLATMRSKAVVPSVVAETRVGNALTFVGLPGRMPLSAWQALAIFLYAMVACLVMNDAVKVTLIESRVPKAVSTNFGKP